MPLPAQPNAASGILADITEPLVPDLRLATALGYARPNDIRKLIVRHAEMLAVIGGGSLRHHGATPVTGGKTATAYELTKAQAAFLIAKSKTAEADSLTALMAEVFAMATDGKLAPTSESAAVALSAAVERDQVRRGINVKEEREARSIAFDFLKRSPGLTPVEFARRQARKALKAARK